MAFEAFVETERVRAERFSRVISPDRQAQVLAEFGRPERRLELFGRWLETARLDRAPALAAVETAAP